MVKPLLPSKFIECLIITKISRCGKTVFFQLYLRNTIKANIELYNDIVVVLESIRKPTVQK